MVEHHLADQVLFYTVDRLSRLQTDPTRLHNVLSASLFCPDTFKTKGQNLNELATHVSTQL